MNDPIYIALIIGLSSSFHCIGMCGPIAVAVPTRSNSSFGAFILLLQYHFGRILTYAALGLLIGNIGLTLKMFGALQWISIISGIALILFAWKKLFSHHLEIPFVGKVTQFISRNIGKIVRSESPFKLLILGMLNGLLPCGMVYIALTNALLTGSPISSAAAMIFFGVGTLPAMLIFGMMLNKISFSLRAKLNKMIPVLLTIVGALIVLRGLNLNIPYLSPKVSLETTSLYTHSDERAVVKMECCESPMTGSCTNKAVESSK